MYIYCLRRLWDKATISTKGNYIPEEIEDAISGERITQKVWHLNLMKKELRRAAQKLK